MNKEDFENIIYNGKNKKIVSAVKSALEEGLTPSFLIDIMIQAMQVVGDRFQSGEIMISDMLSSAMTMKKGITYVTPLIKGEGEKYIGKAIIGMAPGDLHDIGKGLVTLMLESTGFKVIDLGIDVSTDAFIDALRENPDCRILTISAMLDTTAKSVKETIESISKADLRKNIKIIVGGAAFNADLAREVGADTYAPTATLTAQVAKNFLGI